MSKVFPATTPVNGRSSQYAKISEEDLKLLQSPLLNKAKTNAQQMLIKQGEDLSTTTETSHMDILKRCFALQNELSLCKLKEKKAQTLQTLQKSSLKSRNQQLQKEVMTLKYQLINSKVESTAYAAQLDGEQIKLTNMIANLRQKLILTEERKQQQKRKYEEEINKLEVQRQGQRSDAKQILRVQQSKIEHFKQLQDQACTKVFEIIRKINQNKQDFKLFQSHNLMDWLTQLQFTLEEKDQSQKRELELIMKNLSDLPDIEQGVKIDQIFYSKNIQNNVSQLQGTVKSITRNNIVKKQSTKNKESSSFSDYFWFISAFFKGKWSDRAQEIQKNKDLIQRQQNDLKERNNEIQYLKTTISNIKSRENEQKTNIQAQIKHLEKKNSQLTLMNSNKDRDIIRLNGKIEELTKQSNKKSSHLKQLNDSMIAQNDKFIQREKQLKNIINTLKEDINKLTEENRDQKQRISKLGNDLEAQKSEHNRLDQQLKLIIQNFRDYQSKAEQQQNQLKKQLIQLSNNYTKLQKERNQLLIKAKRYEQTIKECQGKITSLQQNLHTKQIQLQGISQQCTGLKTETTNQQQQIAQLSLRPLYRRQYLQYFNGCILNHSNPQDVEWFVSSLQTGIKKTIKSTSLLYRFDPKNKTNFHYYIDSKPNLVLLVRMQNGQIIGGYSEPPLRPKTNIDYQRGMMFGFNKRKIFHVKNQINGYNNQIKPRPMTYDQSYISWGDSDIRIKMGTNQLYSCYGTSSCCYEERGNKNPVVEDFFDQRNRDAYLLGYQVFEVEFEESDEGKEREKSEIKEQGRDFRMGR